MDENLRQFNKTGTTTLELIKFSVHFSKGLDCIRELAERCHGLDLFHVKYH